jgi:hypothetical protein
MATFVPVQVYDANGDWYLCWKIEEAKEEVIPLAQIRRRVVDAWKLDAARKPAQDKANELAAQARKAPADSLSDVMARAGGPAVTEPGKFTWRTRGPVPNERQALPRYSQVEGVDGAAEDFMKTVFSLAPTETGVAMNQAQNKVYVIRLKRFDPLDADLREQFAATKPEQYIDMATVGRQSLVQNWYDGLASEAGVRWHRETRSPSAAE